MHFFLVLTNNCNLRCRYCLGSEPAEIEGLGVDWEVPSEMNYSIADLARFLAKDPDTTIILYGGEPLLRIPLLRKVMDAVPARYYLQTNGLLLDQLDRDHLLRLGNIMLSIDGCRRTTDSNRGQGVYSSVLKAAAFARASGFEREIIARMTVYPGTDVHAEVNHLLSLPDFDSVHWQLDAGFHRANVEEFGRWARDVYNPGVTRLIGEWVEGIKAGEVSRIYPFVGIMESLLREEKPGQLGKRGSRLRCGAGWAHYAILTDGKIAPCPVMGGLRDFYVGDISSSHPLELDQVVVGEPCLSCDVYGGCGGRCLYANKTMLWGRHGFDAVCSTARHIIAELEKARPEVEDALKQGTVTLDNFDYPRFNSCEIMP